MIQSSQRGYIYLKHEVPPVNFLRAGYPKAVRLNFQRLYSRAKFVLEFHPECIPSGLDKHEY